MIKYESNGKLRNIKMNFNDLFWINVYFLNIAKFDSRYYQDLL